LHPLIPFNQHVPFEYTLLISFNCTDNREVSTLIQTTTFPLVLIVVITVNLITPTVNNRNLDTIVTLTAHDDQAVILTISIRWDNIWNEKLARENGDTYHSTRGHSIFVRDLVLKSNFAHKSFSRCVSHTSIRVHYNLAIGRWYSDGDRTTYNSTGARLIIFQHIYGNVRSVLHRARLVYCGRAHLRKLRNPSPCTRRVLG